MSSLHPDSGAASSGSNGHSVDVSITAPGAGAPTLASGTSGIAGIGIDLLRVDRIASALARHGDRFAEKILGQDELAVFHARRTRASVRGLRYLATRFAAKEAFSKAIGLGIRLPMTWKRVQILNVAGGKPVVVLAEPLKSWFEARYGVALVSVTDESDMVAAYVVVQSRS